MAFRDFSFPEVVPLLGLSVTERDLFSDVPVVPVRQGFADQIQEDMDLALAINSEKARSEFVIAPILLELRRSMKGGFGLFSGIELNADSSRGLNGFCDFLISKERRQWVLTAPIISLVEAKNDNIHNGMGQCIAQMVGAWEFNKKMDAPVDTIFGVVTTGTAWKFLKLCNTELFVDTREYFVNDLGKIMGILAHLIHGAKS